ncbi:class I SAM-dependent methyltransferase [Myxococcaceae bacterium JPH2]|nr:class I SAM-dependent methyltransferase [Myxococcaceae bacterium JPH2]
MSVPSSSADFDRAYLAPFTLWGDLRIPSEVKDLVRQESPRTSLELGCGVGRISRYLAHQGLRATGVDFSPVAISHAKARVAQDAVRPEYLVGDVTRLDSLQGPFDMAVDVGCFHCFNPEGQRAYVAEVARLLKPGATHLIWALDSTPSDLKLSPDVVQRIFAPSFELRRARSSRRRVVASHWYWLVHAGR